MWGAQRSRDLANGAMVILAPQVSLMNHRDSPNIAVDFDTRAGGLVLRTLQPIAKGQELLISYADRMCREYAMALYGFQVDGMESCDR